MLGGHGRTVVVVEAVLDAVLEAFRHPGVEEGDDVPHLGGPEVTEHPLDRETDPLQVRRERGALLLGGEPRLGNPYNRLHSATSVSSPASGSFARRGGRRAR